MIESIAQELAKYLNHSAFIAGNKKTENLVENFPQGFLPIVCAVLIAVSILLIAI